MTNEDIIKELSMSPNVFMVDNAKCVVHGYYKDLLKVAIYLYGENLKLKEQLNAKVTNHITWRIG